MGETVELILEPLTDRERQLVVVELRRGRQVDSSLAEHRKVLNAEWGKEMRALLKAWNRLPREGQEFLIHALSDQADLASPTSLDVGAAAEEVLRMIRGRRTATVPGLREAATTLRQVWIERGGSPTIRNLDRDMNEGRGASDLHVFVAKHLIDLFGRDAFSGSLDDKHVLDRACVAADSALTGR